ncbi:MAG: type II toxin-antitoxin system VapC family toxin [Chloroflexota bacterium]
MAIMDSSVYVAILNRGEVGHQASIDWLQRARTSDEQIIAPNVLLAEVGAAVSRGTGDIALARRVLHQLKTSTLIDLRPITSTLANRAAEIAIDYRIRGCDALYVALAEQTGEPLTTLDQQQLQRGSAIVTTTTP